MSCRPMLLQQPVFTTTTGSISSAEKDNVQAIAVGTVDSVTAERSDTRFEGISVSAGMPVALRASKQAAQSFFLNPAVARGGALPKALNAYSPAIVQQVFSVAEDNHSIALLSIQHTLNYSKPEQTDAVAAAMEKASAEYDKNGKESASRSLSQYAAMVSSRAGFLSWLTDNTWGSGMSGDLLWIYAGDITQLAITGHAAVYN